MPTYKDNLPYRSRLDGRSKDILDYIYGLLIAHGLRAKPSDIIRRALTFYIEHIDNLVERTNRDGTLLGDLAVELHLFRKTRGIADSPWKDTNDRPDFSMVPLKPFREYVREQEKKNAQRLLASFKGDPSHPWGVISPDSQPSQPSPLKGHKVLAKSLIKGTIRAAEQLKIK